LKGHSLDDRVLLATFSEFGRRVKENGQGDIEIKVTGLRSGEKLYEELLIDNKSLRATPHGKILRAEEAMLSQIEVASMVRELKEALEHGDRKAIRSLIVKRVEGYHLQEDVSVG
jgi:FlaA1/EpsC-like NDP-sugar epimerase